jgi:DNA-directed RNA polymerase subunit N (RpoN/RPB10)
MIRYRTGYCEMCNDGIEKPLIAKKCSFHYRVTMHKKYMDKQSAKHGFTETNKALDKWFADKMTSPRICENCGKDLSSLSDKDWKGSQHHILEKSLFTSVKTHVLNHLVLGRWCCHPVVTQDPEKIIEMRCFEKAKARVKAMRNDIIFTELRRIPYYFEDTEK